MLEPGLLAVLVLELFGLPSDVELRLLGGGAVLLARYDGLRVSLERIKGQVS